MRRVGAHIKVIEVGDVVDGVARDLAENGVLAIKLGAGLKRDEELASVGVGTVLICTGHYPPAPT